ncbi:type VI secretion system baseplate subunit TssG [Vibrio sp. LaRot3]|uniref:type VI secretion system baseplate subunit TssG n=1 Tax=Vibrio sp. LaRot3 TaxID=2998829 RepID=UPI0022CE280C|nr:type VI secretion system baseplate subunit TssG [Vibrio sp. LaRot3]MDA0148885.1 type VI secretion system baseplate subunit TssG [Vibrio sp. LaRot3]
MGYPSGPATTAVDGALVPQEWPSNVKDYSFYQLVELLHRLEGINPECHEWEKRCQLVFSANPSLGFSPSDISSIGRNQANNLYLETNFFGLCGAESPLPGFMLEQIATEGTQGFKRPFLDFFNNRLISLAYRVWRKYRYYIRFQEDAQDSFSAQLFALVGLGDPYLRGETPINWCKMLAYSGLLAGKSRSPQVVAGIIAHYFDLPQVSITQWQVRRTPIVVEQQQQLGQRNAQLGVDTMLGSKIRDASSKFVIVISGLSRQRYRDFLPTGKEFKPLCKLVEHALREQFAYDIELSMTEEERPQLTFCPDNLVALGWDSFLGETPIKDSVTIQVRQ